MLVARLTGSTVELLAACAAVGRPWKTCRASAGRVRAVWRWTCIGPDGLTGRDVRDLLARLRELRGAWRVTGIPRREGCGAATREWGNWTREKRRLFRRWKCQLDTPVRGGKSVLDKAAW